MRFWLPALPRSLRAGRALLLWAAGRALRCSLRSLRRLPLRFAFWIFWGSCALRMTGAAGAAGVLRAGRSGVASGALTKWGSNLGWALLPRAGAAFSRRARGAAASLGAFAPRLLARRSLRAPRFALLSCISVSSFFGFAGTAFFAAFGSCFGAGAAAFAAFAGAVSACFFGASACFFGASAGFSASGRGFLPRTGGTGRTGAGTPSHG